MGAILYGIVIPVALFVFAGWITPSIEAAAKFTATILKEIKVRI